MNEIFDLQFALQVLPELGKGLIVTLQATAGGMVLALVLGLVWALLKRSPIRLLRIFIASIVQFIRSTPLLVQMYFLFFVFPEWGLTMSALLTGTLALGIHYSTYTAEVYRAGIEAVPRTQWEAAKSLNLGSLKTYQKVVLPQAIPPMIPALGNYLVAMFKDTPLLSAITVLEMLQRAKIIGSETFRYVEPLTLVGIIFLLLSLLASQFIKWLEQKLKVAT